ncbi:MAG TPA: anhydro-N-acetylmuramic acid kinase [Bacilli bacterium]|nr:anhydro-N-acetylmuramic acid kinase [Bacilli bacterium]HQB80338.1 anhydro-N-acetylmuramic acid kinase [Bacilli bacterium]
MKVIGLMSGTSLDGVDAALVEIKGKKVQLLNFVTYPYPKEFKAKLKKNLNNDQAKLEEICSLNFELGDYFVCAIDEVLKDKYSYDDIDLVASHGQTIWHNPKGLKGQRASTLQIGEAAVIVAKTNITTVSNFRVKDVALDGEGAPLVPKTDFLLYHNNKKNIVLQNIGGIGNLTYLPKDAKEDEILAFDTGPGNVMIDYFMHKYYGKAYDEDGKKAFKGIIIKPLYDYLMSDKFIKKAPPKSTGREQYNETFFESLVKKFNLDQYSKEDVICTVTNITVDSIVYNYEKFLKEIDLVVVTGGGSHNKYVVSELGKRLGVEVITGTDYGIENDAKEALSFAYLGYLSFNYKTGNLKSVTGAKENTILGNITYGRYRHG